MSISPLCKITFRISQQQQDKQQHPTCNSISVFPGTNTRQLAENIGRELGCGYQDLIQSQIRSELLNILRDGNGIKRDLSEQQVWRSQMEKVLGLTNQINVLYTNTNKSSPEASEKNLKNTYFASNYDKIFKNKSQKMICVNNKQNLKTIYDRGIAKKREMEQKISMIKKTKEKNEVVECTFAPNIKDTEEFFNKNRPNFFNQEDKQKESTFQRLYKQSFDLKQKRNKRLRTLQNQEEAKLSQLSFVPVINECSREICKMKSYASYIQEIEQIPGKLEQKIKNNEGVSKQNTVKKNKKLECTFHPEISENTKRLTQHLPNFYDRLEMSKQKKKIKQAQHNQSISSTKAAQKPKKPNRIILKKQIYTIDDGSQLQTEKKSKNKDLHSASLVDSTKKSKQIRNIQIQQEPKVEQKYKIGRFQVDEILTAGNHRQKRSKELFNNRKKNILETIVTYFTVKPYVKEDDFSKKQKKVKKITDDTQINTHDIQNNRYIPNFVKELLQPITSELKEAQISLTKREFLWAMEKLFEGLDISDKGSLLGWGVKLLPQ